MWLQSEHKSTWELTSIVAFADSRSGIVAIELGVMINLFLSRCIADIVVQSVSEVQT